MTSLRLLIVFGTRPEAIKLAPLALVARAASGVEPVLCNTGQHADMCHGILSLFGIVPDVDLAIMRPRQTLTEISTAVLRAMEPLLAARRPDWLIVQGDTGSAFAAALAGFYAKVPVAHVEAGLRTGDIRGPWPEEMNRRLISTVASLHFAPLASNAANLRREGIADAAIRVVGNTGIDALHWLLRQLRADEALAARAQHALDAAGIAALRKGAAIPLVLITGHRRESFGEGFRAIAGAIADLARSFPDRAFVYPVHPNPELRDTIRAVLGPAAPANVHLIEPLDYLPFVALMARADLILTDSGGIQEEAPSIGKRVVVMREVTEREEGLATGLVRLAGTDPARIVAAATDAITGAWSPRPATDVYGDGRAAERIIAALLAEPR